MGEIDSEISSQSDCRIVRCAVELIYSLCGVNSMVVYSRA